ncbi:MAG: hypothetical protein A2268_14435 [Candidatus Raymondbacteria bacterium RifOxyA12_full_50_37]|uniref:Uncharacterized protein n=1 Tax=Candidatus Raymondbacteria bacterium RIFOXYD12_FULL_49_13 TaxID=1817890 RepID=A0A1F7F939_UNCRA|nr:MAG: hypothetical protein A2268_14435 [Candidatus Raymondbacteria bacterium RifOxyA12_full_50_37]OGJ87459.1 MAG: hypothetical protein A2350_13890 [Candidatus Raymondbacteria bacterium RifOxyB12_full_50_8]OGJ88618.1 MAG: hypothetical protein A2248_20370 [Candidatus Raymondbacteria bacterium RIFOXYA2_FULL_49_16]OGK02905.1 MAG: hypothetical protein A2487_17940 [Candidatus Raymondbacteria bacterium RifOxyC12_full_50_8]OGK03143.1 MAG: hypothetical protein A2519_06995 [Candidatus Raymondbacteria b
MSLLRFRCFAPLVLFFFVFNSVAYVIPEINAQVKANLRSILKRGQALGRRAGITGQWGDSITNTWVYLAGIGTFGCGGYGAACTAYEPVWQWMGASRPTGDWTNPLQAFKDEYHCNAPGWTMPTGSGCITGAIPLENPSWTLVMYGTNDLMTATASQQWTDATAEQNKQRMKFLLSGVSEYGIIPCVSTVPPLIDRQPSVSLYNQKLKTLAADELQIPLVDFYEALTAYHPTDWQGTSISNDGIHPSARNSDWSADSFNSDGYGMRNRLTGDLATKLKAMIFENSPPDGPDYPILDVVSPTHAWGEYSAVADVEFSWSLDGGATATEYSYVFDQASNTIPDSVSEGAATSVEFTSVQPGNWYFHVRANSALGWGPATHYLVRIVPPGQIVIQNGVNGYTGSKDACLNKLGADGNYSTYAFSFQQFFTGSYGDYKKRMIIRFDDISSILAGKTIYSASFNIMLMEDLPRYVLSDSDSLSLHEVTSTWNPSKVTYNSRDSATPWTTAGGDFNAQRIGTVWTPPAHANTWLSFDVTAQVQAWAANPSLNNGLILCAIGPSSTGGAIVGRHHVAISMRPKLVINTDPGSKVNAAAGGDVVIPVLGAVYPNPGNPAVTIPILCGPRSEVLVQIFAVNGALVKSFNVRNPGHSTVVQNLTWKGDDKAGKNVSSGVYFAQAIAAGHQSAGLRTIMLCR